MATIKSVPQLKAGDVVQQYGGRFQILEDAKESKSTPGLFTAPSLVLSGQVGGYFWPGKEWGFQGNELARFSVE